MITIDNEKNELIIRNNLIFCHPPAVKNGDSLEPGFMVTVKKNHFVLSHPKWWQLCKWFRLMREICRYTPAEAVGEKYEPDPPN